VTASPSLDTIFAAAIELPSVADREAYIARACAGDTSLRDRVSELVAAHFRAGSFLESAAPELAATTNHRAGEGPGTVIGPYKLLEQIGEGGFGIVFLAEQTQPMRRRVALKVLKPGMDSKQVLARFEAERQALALMDHPNIARVLDGGVTDAGRPYFVMELVRGLPITDFCDRSQVPVRRRLELFVSVCRAVQHAHQKGVIHRDLKPSNVLVAVQDGVPVPKVIDFGVAKAVGQALTDKTLYSNFAQMIGTPLYMSPEQAQLSGLDVDTRSDIYSLGVMLYELLTGTTPFDREQMRTAGYDEIRRIIREEEPPRPSTRLSTLGPVAATVSANRGSEPRRLSALFRGELDWIVMKALEKDRNRRYDSASAFAADVERYLGDEPVLARPPSAQYRLGKYLRRNRGPVLAGALVSAAVFAGVIGAAYGAIEAQKQREVNSQREQAEVARDGEASAKREAQEARDRLAAWEYGRTMQVAHQEWRENNVPTTLALLGSTRPEFRGWEWSYVRRLCHADLLTLKGHSGDVRCAAFSPDGARVATGGLDQTVRVWDVATGTTAVTFNGHAGPVQSVSWDAGGTRIVTASADQTAKVWDAKTGAELLTLRGHTNQVTAAAFSPDGARVVTGAYDKTAEKTALVWDAKTGAEAINLRGHALGVTSVAFSPDGTRIVTGGIDKTARVWDAKTGAEVLILKNGHTGPLTAASFSPRGDWILTAGDRTARVWNAKTGVEVAVLQGHPELVQSASFSPDGSRIVTGSFDRTARVWDRETGAEIRLLKGHTHAITAASFSPDGARVLTAGGNDATAKLWDANGNPESLTLRGHLKSIQSAAFSQDGARAVTGGFDDTARVWDTKTGVELLTLNGHADSVAAASFSPDGTRVVTGSGDKTARLWDATTGAHRLTLRGHKDAVLAASFSPDGSRVVTASHDRTARVWNATTGAVLLTLEGHGDAVTMASFSADGSRVLTASLDQTARVWDSTTGATLHTLGVPVDRLSAVAFSLDGSRILTAGQSTARVWDTQTGAVLLTLIGHTDRVTSAAFSPDGNRVMTGSYDRTAKLWDAKTGAEVLTLKGHAIYVTAVAFSPDGTQVMTGSYDRTAKVWDAMPVPKINAPTVEPAR